ncbi:MAG: YggS family pyridoxal phosphate-dependent enzyme [Caldicoprobacterales bacterium]|jgi:pyridoxal phosphate enzyme (YggS family)|nr:YggS family pyridoxal phosphate-dependent enzyme [Clostridiales bacterium]
MSIADNIRLLKDKISKAALSVNRDPGEISVIAVSKNASTQMISEAVKAGITQFGESRVQEMLSKYRVLEKSVDWHFIGPLQTNKVKYIIDKVELIHSLDRISLAKEINKRAELNNRLIQVLVQVNLPKESTKSGIYEEDLQSFIEALADYPYIRVKGLMGIGPNTTDEEAIRTCFRRLRIHFENLRNKSFKHIDMEYLSMGMSNDYMIAIEEGANMVRVGRAIFQDI